jgi:tetratricopeptide (TPR) repeat protein
MKVIESGRRRPALVISLALGLVTFLLYLPIVRNGFVHYDDEGYITDNAHVSQGLSWPGVVWAFKSNEQSNWHPLTWISHMADCQMFGLNPAGHHFINVLFHTANTLLVFFLMRQMTRENLASALVAAFFGWHPLHVESVAWAAERKDVLSAFFWLLTMMVYVRYVRRPAAATYLLALVLFAAALMAKPMAVTLPFVLLLMDYWPLNRLTPAVPAGGTESSNQSPSDYWRTGAFLVLEKLPFFALTLADSYLTFLAQKNGGSVLSISALPFSYRFVNALWSYLRYVSNTFYPNGLSIIYPYKANLPVGLVTVSILLLVIWSVLFVLWRKKSPYLLVGWLWFLGTLIPTIGFIQVGAQSMADRYMYIPSIGLFIIVVWGARDLMQVNPGLRKIFLVAGTAALALCLVATSWQITYWRNTATIFVHAINVTGDNPVAYFTLGTEYERAGDRNDALTLYKKSVETGPNYYPAEFNLGRMLLENGDDQAARSHFKYAKGLNGGDPLLEFNWGLLLLKAGRNEEGSNHLQTAVQMLRTASQVDPGSSEYHFYLAGALQKLARTPEAIQEYSNVLRLDPDYPEARYGLAAALITAGRTNEAIGQYRNEVTLHVNDPEAHYNLGLALLENQQFGDAEKEFAIELQQSPAELKAHYRLAQARAGEHQYAAAAAQYREALQILPDFADAKKELAALLAAHPELK